jgi:hypothetical protein
MNEVVATGQTVDGAKKELGKILKLVQVMLEMADRESTPPGEAANARAKAEQLMRKYRIQEEQLIASDATAIEPIWDQIVIGSSKSPFYNQYYHLWSYVAQHTGVRYRYSWVGSDLTMSVVGYEPDVRFAQMLYASARLVFQERIDPQVKPELGDAENCYRLRSAGIERNRIANMLWGASTGSDGAWAHRKVGNLYKEACAQRGEDPALNGRQINAKTFRESYAKNFVEHFASLLRQARNAADSNGGVLELKGRSERVDEAFYSRYPEMRPVPVVAEEQEESCENCERASKKEPGKKCRKHTWRWTAADQARWNREQNSLSAQAGRLAGREAASQVELNHVAKAKRLEEDSARKTVRQVTGLELEG